jgi:hypothetical protein
MHHARIANVSHTSVLLASSLHVGHVVVLLVFVFRCAYSLSFSPHILFAPCTGDLVRPALTQSAI